MSFPSSLFVGPYVGITAVMLIAGVWLAICRKPSGAALLDLTSRLSPLLAMAHYYHYKKWILDRISAHGNLDFVEQVQMEKWMVHPLVWIIIFGSVAGVLTVITGGRRSPRQG